MDETIAEFDAALRKLAVHCQFGEMLEASLRDQFVCGLRRDTIQRRLLSETMLTYYKMLEIACGMELANKEMKPLSCQNQQSRSWEPYLRSRRSSRAVSAVVVQTIRQRTASSRMRSAIFVENWDTSHLSAGQGRGSPRKDVHRVITFRKLSNHPMMLTVMTVSSCCTRWAIVRKTPSLCLCY